MDFVKLLKHRPKLASAMVDVAKMKSESTPPSTPPVDAASVSLNPAVADYDPPPPSRFWE